MANNILTVSMITRESLRLFVNTGAFIKNINRQFDDEFGKNGQKIGSQLRIRLPNDYIVTDGPGVVVQDTSEQQVVLTMSTQRHVDVSFSTAQLLLELDDFSERIAKPMMNNLAGNVQQKIMSDNAEAFCNMNANLDNTGALLDPTSGTYLDGNATLALNSAPPTDHKIINDPRQEARVVQSLSGLFNPSAAITDQYYQGTMYRALNALWFSDQTVIKHTTGTFTTGSTSSAGQTGPTLAVNAISGTIATGDIFTIAGVFAVNRNTKATTGELRQFVAVNAVLNGGTSITIYPSIIPAVAGNAVQYQTVDASPANSATITPYLAASTTYRNSFLYYPEAITMATGDLPLPANKKTARHRYQDVSMRFVQDYMIGTDQEISRFDVLFGSLTPRPEWAVRIPGKI